MLQEWHALGEAETKINKYFEIYNITDIQNCMTTELRAIAGLGFPPKPYTPVRY